MNAGGVLNTCKSRGPSNGQPANGCVTREQSAVLVGDSRPNGRVIPHTLLGSHGLGRKLPGRDEGLAAYQLVGGVTAHQGVDG